MKTKLIFKAMPENYQALLSLHMLRPIRDKIDYSNALEVMNALAGHDLTEDQEDYFEALALLVEAYETSHLPSLPNKRGLPLLRHLMEENKMSAASLSRVLDVDRSLGVRILNGERNLTIEHVKKLTARFLVPVQVFLS